MKTVHWLLMGLVLFASTTVASQTEFPACEAAPKLQTEIHLYIDASVLDQYSEEYVELSLRYGSPTLTWCYLTRAYLSSAKSLK